METEQLILTLPDRGSIEPPSPNAEFPSGRVFRWNGRSGGRKRWEKNIKRNNEALKCACCLAGIGFGIKSLMSRLGLSHGTVARFLRNSGFKSNAKQAGLRRRDHSLAARRLLAANAERHAKRIERGIEAVIKETVEFYETKLNASDRLRKSWREREKAKYHSDPQHMLKARLRRRLRKLIMESKTGRKSESFVGCSLAMLVEHIQSKFKDGMNWSNYGSWHIDHIRPCSSFDMTNESQVLKCFHYSNLQPLWAMDNLFKGDRWSDNVIVNDS